MLRYLSIKNIVLIDDLEIDFGPGLCVLTGETGAGKSIILDSLCLVIGYRANYSLRPDNNKVTEVISIFSEISDELIRRNLKEFGIPQSSEIILKRQLTPDGKSKAFINDHLVSLMTLKKIGSQLIEIEGQFSEQGLLDTSTHIDILDQYGDYKNNLDNLKNSWEDFQSSKKLLYDIANSYEKNINNKEHLEFEIGELEKLNPQENEYEVLLNKKKNYINSTKIEENIGKVIANFSSEQNQGIEELIAENISHLEKINEFLEPGLKDSLKALDTMLIEIQDYKNRFEEFYRENVLSSSNIDGIEERIYLYKKLSSKYKCSFNDLIKKKESLINELDSIGTSKLEVEKYKIKSRELENKYIDKAKNISEKRIFHGKKIDELINHELPELKLENAEFKTFITNNDSPTQRGVDKIMFKIRTNKNSLLDEIKKISSGGELCRFALAIKVVTSKESSKSIVFDEVDSGIGGAVASSVGERLRRLGENRQVIVITHSPQVASLGNEHFKVIKTESTEKNLTDIKKLNDLERVNEIARMLSGKEITNEALMAARKLLEL